MGAGKKEEGTQAKRVKREEGAPPAPTKFMVKQDEDKDFDFEVLWVSSFFSLSFSCCLRLPFVRNKKRPIQSPIFHMIVQSTLSFLLSSLLVLYLSLPYLNPLL